MSEPDRQSPGRSVDVEIRIDHAGSTRRLRHSMDGSLSVGRGVDCDVRIEGTLVSRRHARLRLQGQQVCVEDCSRNGILIGGRMLHRQSTQVPLGTPLHFGDHTLTVTLAEPASRVPEESAGAPRSAEDQATPQLRREILRQLVENLNLENLDPTELDDPALRPRVLSALRQMLVGLASTLPPGLDCDQLVGELADEALGFGPLERLLSDPTITEIMVVNPTTIYVERAGRIIKTDARFTDDERVRAVIERIVAPLGRRIDESSPLVDARLPDGARVNVVIRPLAVKGTCITIRRFPRVPLTLDRLVELGSLSRAMGRFLTRSVVVRKNILVAGGTASGKTTLLNVLSAAIPEHERIVTIEDAAELQLGQPHVVALETRPANAEGRGEYRTRDLVRNAMRMRPDRIVVGECRGGEALDMLQAMNTGHDGSLTTLHANSPREAMARLETLALMADVGLPVHAIREQMSTSLDLVVQQQRYPDGARKVSEIAGVAGLDDNGNVTLRSIFRFETKGLSKDGSMPGEYRFSGYLPPYVEQFLTFGLVREGEGYL
jgi:pilus assembly protein CpaF